MADDSKQLQNIFIDDQDYGVLLAVRVSALGNIESRYRLFKIIPFLLSFGILFSIFVCIYNALTENDTNLYILAGFVFFSMLLCTFATFKGKKDTAKMEEAEKYPQYAISYKDDKFYIITDKIEEIKIRDIVSMRARNWLSLKEENFWSFKIIKDAVGSITIKTENNKYFLVQIFNPHHVVKILKSIKKNLNKEVDI